jgi:3-hydroxyisobutyrate dehydrogenase-like beta-hydroxyacid dehydrogenase
MIIGVLHPGEMGISLAASAIRSGNNVYWASDGRSEQTASRAAQYALLDARSIEKLCHTSQVVLSICPPHAAEQVADQVLTSRFRGLYIDANAISPQRAKQMAERMTEAGVSFVDGCVIGGPAWNSGETWLYLSGENADKAAELFSGGPIETGVVGSLPGKASALKMCYASYTKGTIALLGAVMATAESLGVREELENQWSQEDIQSVSRAHNRIRQVTRKAWRFSSEMQDISATYAAAGLPGEFHLAAGEIYQRLEGFKNAPNLPEMEDVLNALLNPDT